MKLLNTIALISIISVTVGCAPKKPLTYDTERSKALNIVKAAKMDYGLRDVAVAKDTVSDIRDSAGYGLAYGWAGYNAPSVGGLSSSATAGMNVLAWALQPKSPSARNSVIAWMPESIGGKSKEDALDKMADIIIEASEKAAKDLKFSPRTFIGRKGTDKRGFAVTLTNNNSENCKVPNKPNSTVSGCNIVYKVRYPHKIDNTTHFVGNGSTWFFDPIEKDFTSMIFKNKLEYNQLDLLIATSKYLPEWVYIYLAPGEVKMSGKEKLKVPMILNKGKPHYFIKVKDS